MNALARSRVAPAVQERMAVFDWARIGAELDTQGCAILPALLSVTECADLAARYGEDPLFRSKVVMARHGFGRGEYKYLAYPLPEPVAALRMMLYPPLAAIANRWNQATRFFWASI